MLSRALILAAVISLFAGMSATHSQAQNLEAGKPPSAIFSSTCSLCHKSSRGLLKSVAPGSLPGFLRQHYTTSTDMAGAMSAYVMSNGAANAALPGGNLTKQGEDSRSAPKPSATADARPDRDGKKDDNRDAQKGRKPPRSEVASRPDVDGLEDVPGAPPSVAEEERKPEGSKAGAKQKGAKDGTKGKPPKVEASREPARQEPKTEAMRSDPVPAVTPAPEGGDNTLSAGPKSVAELPTGPLTIDLGPPAPKTPTTEPAGPPRVPISR